jgi:L-arabinose isomerase
MTGTEKLNVGLFGIGLDTYWPQFDGLKERLESYQQEIAGLIGESGEVNLINGGLVDNPNDPGPWVFSSNRNRLIYYFCIYPPTLYPPPCCPWFR